jgi:hypothetical protein
MSNKNVQQSLATTTLVTTAETAVGTFTIPPENNPTGQGVYIEGSCIVTTGAAATSLTMRLRLGSGLGGSIVGGPVTTVCNASSTGQGAQLVTLDQTQVYPAGQQYTVTIAQNAATGNGVMQSVLFTSEPVSSALG